MTPNNTKNSIKSLVPRPPIVVVMGHVDHGKTSLLDYVRKTNVVAREAGGITQATGAYEVDLTRTEPDKNTDRTGKNSARKITFIDTPGHEAFSSMRARGAKIADMAILVVAADEGVKPQTREAIKILTDSETPYIVAFTKIDKPNADVDRVKNELLSEGVMLEGYGGNVSNQGISVKTGEGIDDLLNLILLLGEVEGLTCDPSAPARGYIIESHKDNRRGIVANFILKDGTLNEGDEVATETASGKTRTLENFLGKRVKKLFPSAPGVIVGFETLPKVGEEFAVGGKPSPAETKADAEKAETKKEKGKIGVIFKADTSGSLEVLRQVIEPIASVVDSSVGEITSSDVKTAMATGGVIIGFGVKIDKANESLAQIHGVKIFISDIIYELLKSLDSYIKGEAGPVAAGELEILKIFNPSGKKQVIGCKVAGGVVKQGANAKIFRLNSASGDTEEIGKGKISNLQSDKKDVNELKSGECGILFDSETVLQVGDRIGTY